MTKHTISRSPHVPTAASRRRVSIWAGGGASAGEIASALEIDRATLAELYAEALAAGALRCRLEVLETVFRQAKRGHVGAARLYLSAPWHQQPAGLKAQRNEQAKVAQQNTEWPDLLPKSVQ